MPTPQRKDYGHDSCRRASIHEVKYDDITIAEEYLNGNDAERCKNALWSVHNVFRRMKDDAVHKSLFQLLFEIGKHSSLDRDSLIFTGIPPIDATNGFSIEFAQYEHLHYYGFVLSDFIYVNDKAPMTKNKVALRKLLQTTLTYNADDFKDVIFGLKLLADICAKHSWPFFDNADIRVAFANAKELNLPIWQEGESFQEVYDYFITDKNLRAGVDPIVELIHKYKMRCRIVTHRSYAFTYKGENVLYLAIRPHYRNKDIGDNVEMNRLHIALSIGKKEDAEKFFLTLPDEIKSEYLSSPLTHCGGCKYGRPCENKITFNGSEICTFGFSYTQYNPTAEQFALIQQFVALRVENIENTPKIKKSPLPTKEKSSYEARWTKRSNASKFDGEVPIFEQTNKQQRLIKPPIDDCVDYFLKDAVTKSSMERLLKIVRKLDMEPRWKSKNRYDCRYNVNDVISFRLEGENDFNVSVFAFGWRESHFPIFISSLPNSDKSKFLGLEKFHCTFCNKSCDTIVIEGDEQILCPVKVCRFVYENPTLEQVDILEWMINIARDYIDFKKTK